MNPLIRKLLKTLGVAVMLPLMATPIWRGPWWTVLPQTLLT